MEQAARHPTSVLYNRLLADTLPESTMAKNSILNPKVTYTMMMSIVTNKNDPKA
jgi:hypothetical protein